MESKETKLKCINDIGIRFKKGNTYQTFINPLGIAHILNAFGVFENFDYMTDPNSYFNNFKSEMEYRINTIQSILN